MSNPLFIVTKDHKIYAINPSVEVKPDIKSDFRYSEVKQNDMQSVNGHFLLTTKELNDFLQQSPQNDFAAFKMNGAPLFASAPIIQDKKLLTAQLNYINDIDLNVTPCILLPTNITLAIEQHQKKSNFMDIIGKLRAFIAPAKEVLNKP